jgi:hypothetical protein
MRKTSTIRYDVAEHLRKPAEMAVFGGVCWKPMAMPLVSSLPEVGDRVAYGGCRQ